MGEEVHKATLGDLEEVSTKSARKLNVASVLESQRWTDEDPNALEEEGGGSMFDQGRLGVVMVFVLKQLNFFLGLCFIFWACLCLNDIFRTFFVSINILSVATGGDGFVVELSSDWSGGENSIFIGPPENLDFFTVEVLSSNVTNTTETVVVLNEFLIWAQNINVLTLVVTASFACYALAYYGLQAYGPCSRGTWDEAVLLEEDYEHDGLGIYVGITLFVLMASLMSTVAMVWTFPPDMLGYYRFSEWLYVPGHERLANALGYIGIILVALPCYLGLAYCAVRMLPCAGKWSRSAQL